VIFEAMGFALGVIVLSQYKRRRIKERIKYNFAEWFSYQHETSDCVNNEIISIGEDAIMEVIASSNNTLSSNLNCSRIQMKKGTQIITETKGVEVYYIIHGSLQFSWKDSEKTTVEANGSIIVPPWT
jgi:mannose-6-phosphate isomerase-like protein (cupin superfamily)